MRYQSVAFILAMSLGAAVYDLAGRRVATLVTGAHPGGEHRLAWDARDDHGHSVAPGVYFYRMRAPEFSRTKRMILLR